MTTHAHPLPAGATLLPEGGTRFRVWAPGGETVGLLLEGSEIRDGREHSGILSMRAQPDGWHELVVASAGAGTRYQFVLPDAMKVPDPASRFQPEDVHGPSEVIDPAGYDWTVPWAGRPWDEIVLYELHVGAFTPEGTFRAAIGKLDHLQRLGITGIEIMPVWDFPGSRNWGYDGVLPYAPDSSYGRPEDFKAFIEAAHQRGIAVLLDVVYNHFGPDGNYLPVYAPKFFTDRHQTPWGAAVNYDGEYSEPVREFVINNALYWIKEYELDGLRLDAVHAIIDEGPRHLLDELAERVRAALEGTGCPVVDGCIIGAPPKALATGQGRSPAVYVSGDPEGLTAPLARHGLNLKPMDAPFGAASALKLVYAMCTKGVTALAAGMFLAAEREGAGAALRAELARSQPELVERFGKAMPDMLPKAYRWIAEMREIALFLGPDDPAAAMLEGAARVYERLAADRNGAGELSRALLEAAAPR